MFTSIRFDLYTIYTFAGSGGKDILYSGDLVPTVNVPVKSHWYYLTYNEGSTHKK